MSFVRVEANLIYILEDELKPDFQRRLCMFKNAITPIFIIVQLKSSPLDSQPMISDLKNIRIDKAIKKIDNWIKICLKNRSNIVVKVIDGLPQKSVLDIDFDGVGKLNVYRSHFETKQILPLVKRYFNPEQICQKYFD